MSRQLNPIDQAEFEEDCRAARERAYALIGKRPHLTSKPVETSQQPVAKERKPRPDQIGEDRVIVRRSNAKLYALDGKSMALPEWSAMCGHSVALLHFRLKSGMTFEQAVTTPKLKRSVPWKQQMNAAGPGVGENFAPSHGTGGGSLAQDISEIEFSQ